MWNYFLYNKNNFHNFIYIIIFCNFIYSFIYGYAGPSLGFCLVAEGWGYFLVRELHRLLIAVASLVAEHGL